MATIVSNNKYYKEIAEKIRKSSGGTTQYKPSEMSSAITSMTSIVDKYEVITNGAVFSGNNASIKGTKMYNGMFAASNITSFEIPENITEISDYAFYHSTIETIILHDNITTFGANCFNDCNNLTTISFPSSLSTIKNYALYGSGLTGKIIIPNTVSSVEYGAFGFTDITCIDIPITISNISNRLVGNCEYLEAVILRSETVCTLGTDVFEDTPITETDTTKILGYIYVPSTLVDGYKADTNWSIYADRIRAIEDYPDICGQGDKYNE